MIRIPNRGVIVAGAALSSVSLVVGVLGSSSAAATAAAPQQVAPRSVVVAPTSTTALNAAERRAVADNRAMAAERRSITAQAAAVAAAAGASATAKPKPKPKPKRASRDKQRAPLTPREMAQALVAEHPGWKPAQFSCLDKLWTRESGWDPHNENGGSGAYGIPQSLPGRKMASFGSDWRDNPMTQIKWGIWYIADRYDTPCAAWAHSERYNYY